MELEAKRAVIDLGGSSVIALPRDWIRTNGVRPGDRVTLSYDGDSITIRPARKP